MTQKIITMANEVIPDPEYAGFWIRVAAALIDTLLLMCIIIPATIFFFGVGELTNPSPEPSLTGFLLNWLVPMAATVAFWIYRSATPGKILLKLKIVDRSSLRNITTKQAFIRYLGYMVSSIVICLGLVWVAFNKEKRGWHDYMAGTVVIKANRS